MVGQGPSHRLRRSRLGRAVVSTALLSLAGQDALDAAWAIGQGSTGGSSSSSRCRIARPAGPDAAEQALEDLVEVSGEYTSDIPREKLEELQRIFPEVNVSTPGLRLVSQDPPVFLLENVLTADECTAFVESMRDKDGSFPERLGQSDLPALPSWIGGAKNIFRGVPVLDWLGNPTVRWTYRSRGLLDGYLNKVRELCGLDLQSGAANIKHYRKDQWLPVHIDYNRATLMTFLNEVEEGGHTLFPTLGIKVKPSRGSALVWPNQPALKHAGDRVVDGEKWILFYNWPAEQNWEYDGNFDFNE